ncbi:unnamed protein product, partial [Coregonus sp. 'balchen']
MDNCTGHSQFLLSSFLLTCLFGLSLGTELSFVTCGSVVKLLNVKHNVRLHSHDVRYGSGSGQQSVTGVTTVEDSNSYWSVRGTSGGLCHRGTPINCGQTIRLTHCGGAVWEREEAVRFQHASTDALLSITGEQYGRPIHGQREVHAMTGPSQHSLWRAMEGVYMKP